jgi:hypothetical protein
MNIKFYFLSTFLFSSFLVNAQNASVTYAITGNGDGDFHWKNIQQVDLSTGKLVKNIFVSGTNARILDGVSKIQLGVTDNTVPDDLIAASAFDKQHNKLFYATIRAGQLRWIDFNNNPANLNIYYYREQTLNAGADTSDQAFNITRMCIGADGNGYAITNDGNHLFQFTTGDRPAITDLGNLVDADASKGMSIHNQCSSWGGDIVADAFGKLYLISATHSVFSIDIDSRIATYVGAVTGLPGNYTTNGAAVDDDGNIVVSSANSYDGFYKVNFADLSATKIEGSDKFNASDLANGNLLLQKEANATDYKVVSQAGNNIYPNPVTAGTFNVLFNGQAAGKYNIVLTDLSGRTVFTKTVTVAGLGQVESIKVSGGVAKGTYLVKVASLDNVNGFAGKIVIE